MNPQSIQNNYCLKSNQAVQCCFEFLVETVQSYDALAQEYLDNRLEMSDLCQYLNKVFANVLKIIKIAGEWLENHTISNAKRTQKLANQIPHPHHPKDRDPYIGRSP